ncbi:MAG: hypothetical protein ACRDIV_17785 [Ktedonobacteraceae bacterium]
MPEKEKKLTASEVAIKTAVIEVKVLQIGNRQFTLSVFDQLEEEPVIDPDTGKLCGTAWGRVNRHTNCKELTKRDLEHLHIIWQKGNELRKCIAAIPWQATDSIARHDEMVKLVPCSYFQKLEYRNMLAELWMKARILAGYRFDVGWNNPPIPFNIADNRFELRLSHTITSAARTGAASYLPEFRQDLKHHIGSTQVAAVERYLIDAASEVGKFVTTWLKSYEQLTKLDQLFIAV